MKLTTRGESDLSTVSAKSSRKESVCGGAKPGLSEKKKVYLSGNEVFLAALGKLFEQGVPFLQCTLFLIKKVCVTAITMTIIVMMRITKTMTTEIR